VGTGLRRGRAAARGHDNVGDGRLRGDETASNGDGVARGRNGVDRRGWRMGGSTSVRCEEVSGIGGCARRSRGHGETRTWTVECGGDVGFPSWVVIGPTFSNFHGLLYRFVTVR
jgi:hypothetical protein